MKYTQEELVAVDKVLRAWDIPYSFNGDWRDTLAAEILDTVAPMIVKRDRSRFIYSNVGSKRRGW